MLKPNKKDGDVVGGMLVQRMFEQGVAGGLSVLNIAHEVNRTLIIDDIPELITEKISTWHERVDEERNARHHKPGSRIRLLHKAPSQWYRVHRLQTPSSRYPQGSS